MSNIPAEHIEIAFRCLLNRSVESSITMEAFQKLSDIDLVIAEIRRSQEAIALREVRDNQRPSPFWNFNSSLDALSILTSHENTERKPVDGRYVNYIGAVINPAVFPPVLNNLQGQVESVPLPANWHADIAEFAAALRAVDLSQRSFRMLELGCGWGCWMLITGTAARNRGLDVELIGAEGDNGHVEFAVKGCAENGFSPDQYRVFRGVVGAKSGRALFPKQDVAGVSWGLEPIFNVTNEEAEAAKQSGKFDVLPILTLDTLIGSRPIDLLHMDIQGGEVIFIEGCLPDLTRLVRYLVIGTHSREIEGRLMTILTGAGWLLEIERPAIFDILADGSRLTRTDGIQGWLNTSLRQPS